MNHGSDSSAFRDHSQSIYIMSFKCSPPTSDKWYHLLFRRTLSFNTVLSIALIMYANQLTDASDNELHWSVRVQVTEHLNIEAFLFRVGGLGGHMRSRLMWRDLFQFPFQQRQCCSFGDAFLSKRWNHNSRLTSACEKIGMVWRQTLGLQSLVDGCPMALLDAHAMNLPSLASATGMEIGEVMISQVCLANNNSQHMWPSSGLNAFNLLGYLGQGDPLSMVYTRETSQLPKELSSFSRKLWLSCSSTWFCWSPKSPICSSSEPHIWDGKNPWCLVA